MGIEVPGLAGQLLVIAPYVLLALVALLFLHRRGEVPPPLSPGDIGRDGIPAAQQARLTLPPAAPEATDAPSRLAPAAVAAAELPAAPSTSAVQEAPPQSGGAPAVPATPAAAQAVPSSPAVDGRPQRQRTPTLADIEAALQRAEAAGRESEVALLCLYLARRRKAEGAGDDIEGVRRCVRIAAQLGLKELHGEARLDLGDEARAAGDLTTACEHWQLARSLFEEAKLPAKKEGAEARMKRFGCPTDWVLNDF